MTASFMRFLMTNAGCDDELVIALKHSLEIVELLVSQFPPLLVLMNINGCLVHRTDERIEFVKHDENDPKYKRHVQQCKVKRYHCYWRDGYLVFLRSLMMHPRVNFAFYSSIMQKNILPILRKTFEDDMGLFDDHMFAIFDQTHCKKSPEITGEKFGFIRDLEKVWATKRCTGFFEKTGKMFSEANTLMIETEETQVHDWFENALIVDRYGREDVWPVPDKEFRDQRSILNSIEDDLFKLMDAKSDDVRQAI